MEPIRLDIGCGSEETKRVGYIGVDAYTDAADIKANMWDLPYEDESVDEIYSAQALEHIPKNMVVPTLQEWKRVLKSGGKMHLQLPDLEWACMWWLSHQSIGWDMDIIYGTQKHEGEFHKTGFSTKIIWDYLQDVGGFTDVTIEFSGGQSELIWKPQSEKEEDFGIVNHVTQRCIEVEAIRL